MRTSRFLGVLAVLELVQAWTPVSRLATLPGLSRWAAVREGSVRTFCMNKQPRENVEVTSSQRRGLLKGGFGAALGFLAPHSGTAVDIGPSGIGNPTEINGQRLEKDAECRV